MTEKITPKTSALIDTIVRTLSPKELALYARHFEKKPDETASLTPIVATPLAPTVIPWHPTETSTSHATEEDISKITDYEEFDQRVPYIYTKDEDFVTFPRANRTWATRFAEIRYELDRSDGKKTNISTLTVPYKGEDAIGIAVEENGIVNLALADGVSSVVLPKVSSRIAVIGALQQMTGNPPSSETFDYAHSIISKFDLRTMAQGRVDYLKTGPLSPAGQVAERHMSNFFYTDRISATTLTVAQYDPVSGDLSYGVLGDSPLIIFRALGNEVEQYETGRSQLQNKLNSDSRPFIDEALGKTQIREGDVVMLCSDGLIPSSFKEINNFLSEQRKNPGVRLDKAVADYIDANVAEFSDGIDDDVSVILFSPTNMTETPQTIQQTSPEAIQGEVVDSDTVEGIMTQLQKAYKDGSPTRELEERLGTLLELPEDADTKKAYEIYNLAMDLKNQKDAALDALVSAPDGLLNKVLSQTSDHFQRFAPSYINARRAYLQAQNSTPLNIPQEIQKAYAENYAYIETIINRDCGINTSPEIEIMASQSKARLFKHFVESWGEIEGLSKEWRNRDIQKQLSDRNELTIKEYQQYKLEMQKQIDFLNTKAREAGLEFRQNPQIGTYELAEPSTDQPTR